MNIEELKSLKNFQKEVHQNAVNHGWWDEPREDGTLIMLMVRELSEGFEGLRAGNPPDEHCPEYTNLEVELADTVIRILDYAEGKSLRVIDAMLAKHCYNKDRPYRHGNKKF